MRKSIILLLLVIFMAACGASQTPAPSADDAWACEQPQSPKWGGGSAGDPYYILWGNGGIDVQHYDVDLTVDTAGNKVDGHAVLEIEALQDLDAFNLDFLGMDISDLKVNGDNAKFCRNEFGELTILPAKGISAGDSFRVDIAYGGEPASRESEALGYSVGWLTLEEGFFAFSSPEIPSFLYPANEYHTDVATYTFRITVPDDMQAFAPGELLETSGTEETITTKWEVTEPIVGSTFIAVGPYDQPQTLEGLNGMNVNLSFSPSVREKNRAKFAVLPEMLEVYSGMFGEFPYRGLGITWVDGLPADAITIPGRIFINSGRVEKIMAHEVARQWFGVSLVPAAVEDTWLTEGMADYASVFLWDEHIGTDITDQISSEYSNLPLSTGAPALASTYENTTDVVYFRSAIALHALRVHVGDETFFHILKEFNRMHGHGIVTTADFIATAESVGGEDLTGFFNGWLYEEAIPGIPEMGLSKGN